MLNNAERELFFLDLQTECIQKSNNLFNNNIF